MIHNAQIIISKNGFGCYRVANRMVRRAGDSSYVIYNGVKMAVFFNHSMNMFEVSNLLPW